MPRGFTGSSCSRRRANRSARCIARQFLRRLGICWLRGAAFLTPPKLELGEGTMIYNPQQLTRHFGYDHGMVILTGELASSSALIAEARFVSERKDQILAGMDVSSGVGWPCWSEVDRERTFLECLGITTEFLNEQDEPTLVLLRLTTIKQRDHFFSQTREQPSMTLESARESLSLRASTDEDDDLLISRLRFQQNKNRQLPHCLHLLKFFSMVRGSSTPNSKNKFTPLSFEGV